MRKTDNLPIRLHSHTNRDVNIISRPTDGRYANLSDAITLVKAITPIVGNIATKKNSHPTAGLRVHRSDINRAGINTQVPITHANTIELEKSSGTGKG